MKTRPKFQRGFSLIEVLVSLFILSTVLAGVFSVFVMTRNIARRTRHTFVASGLVQEGIEAVRNLRDSDWLAGNDFGSFGGPEPVADGEYTVQWDSRELLPSADENKFLSLNGNTNAYEYDPAVGEATIYWRKIEIKTIQPDVEEAVIVTVSWLEKEKLIEIKAEEHLFNWY